MLNHLGCGTFHHEDDESCLGSPSSKSKRKDNPYSTRGLDKFSALLADLDERRQKIYSQMSPHDISFVRFVYSNTDDIVPIVVKVKNNKDQKNKSQELKVLKPKHMTSPTSEPMNKSNAESSEIVEETKQSKLEHDHTKVHKKRFSWNIMKKWDMWKPSFYVPMVMILILVFLTVFGRSVSTLCTCILWYVIPALKDNRSSSNSRKSMKKKDYVRGLSEKKMVINEGVVKKKDYARGLSEKKMVVREAVKKKDYVRRWSEKKIATDGLLSPRSDDSEASKNKSSTKHGHKKSCS